ncbi:MAG: pyridoxal phosphate-dependent aminotransferase [Ardenticatenales bacterium]|nr:pyridoxal phosphate-dependent aminotransferase [Ardenticatenales bacterium]
MSQISIPGFKSVPRTGVIYVMHKATQQGFSYHDPEWANLGQGSPETGTLPEAPARISEMRINPAHQAYAPVEGQIALRQKVADFYNQMYRQGKSSQYTYENVGISGGGRVALTRLAAALGNINMGHFLPDYTAYEELLSVFKAFIPIPILLDPTTGYRISIEALENEVLGRGLNAILASNPCNPTGQLVEGEELQEWVELARRSQCTFILDEFYSHYIYTGSNERGCKIVSAAAYVEDVNSDPIILVDGLTKNWRYPGWRLSWTVGPKEVIELVASAGSFLDGGANNPFQQEAISLLEMESVLQETKAIQQTFGKKRQYVLERLESMGIQVNSAPDGAFYVWANLSQLPAPLNDCMRFFEAALHEKTIVVPGIFFDVNPGKRRSNARYQSYCRISFGPEMEKLERGLDGIERMIRGR